MAYYRKFFDVPSSLEKDFLISQTVKELFKHLEDSYKCRGEIPDESLIALDSVFGETLEKALEIVEGNSVKFFHINSQSVGVFQIQGRSNNNYIIFPCINYCPCLDYRYKVAGGSSFTCKHVLATLIAKVIGKVEPVEIVSSQLYNLLSTAVGINE